MCQEPPRANRISKLEAMSASLPRSPLLCHVHSGVQTLLKHGTCIDTINMKIFIFNNVVFLLIYIVLFAYRKQYYMLIHRVSQS